MSGSAAPQPESTPNTAAIRPAAQRERPRGIRLRAVLLALTLAPLTAYWSVDQTVDVIFSLLIPPVILTLIVALANLIVRRFAPRFALTEGEIIVFYAMHAITSAICAEWMNVIQPAIHSYALYRDSDSHYDDYINPYANPWFFVPPRDAEKFRDYANGGLRFSQYVQHLHLWWRYIFSWTALVSLVCLAMLCINSLMRDAWTNRERLAFPIIQLPMAIAQTGAGRSQVWKSRFFVIPFLLMFTIDIVNGFHSIYPSVPLLNVRYLGDMKLWFPNPPFNAIGWTPIGIFPYMSAIGFFMPTDLLFSCIFFFFFRKAEQVFTYSLGYTDSAGVFGGGGLVPSPPYFSEQSWGAFLALFVTAIYVARGYLKEVWGEIWRGHPKGSEKGTSAGGVPHRLTFLGLLFSIAGVCGIGLYVGLPLWMVAATVLLFLAFSMALTRMRAQIGAPSHEMAFMGPNQMIVDFVGTQSISQASISRLVTMFFFMNRIHRAHPMPHQLEAMKMGETARINQRVLFAALLLATVWGSVLGHLVSIYSGYHWAAPQGGNDRGDVIAELVEQRHPANISAMSFVFVGFCFVLLLDFVRFRVPVFPLHPVGYALAMNFGLDYFWFGLIIVWLIKLFVERYYGLRGYDKLHQAALGIILAEFVAEAIWTTYAMVTREATYSISINGRLSWDQ